MRSLHCKQVTGLLGTMVPGGHIVFDKHADENVVLTGDYLTNA